MRSSRRHAAVVIASSRIPSTNAQHVDAGIERTGEFVEMKIRTSFRS